MLVKEASGLIPTLHVYCAMEYEYKSEINYARDPSFDVPYFCGMVSRQFVLCFIVTPPAQGQFYDCPNALDELEPNRPQ